MIGRNNDIPWYLPADLKYFKKTTLGHAVIMGRQCFTSIGKPLPKRTNIIITRDPFFITTGSNTVHSVAEALSIAKKDKEEEVFIIGGGQIYEQTKHLWHRLYLTEVELEVEGEIYFPEIDIEEWRLISIEPHQKDENNAYNYQFKVFERI